MSETAAGDGPANPLTLTQEEMLEAMQASGGYVCFCFHGMGWTTYLRWHPALGQYEALTTRRRTTMQQGVVVVNSEVSDHWAVTEGTVGDFIPDPPTAPGDMSVDVLRYEETPFDGAGAPDQEWQPEAHRARGTGA